MRLPRHRGAFGRLCTQSGKQSLAHPVVEPAQPASGGSHGLTDWDHRVGELPRHLGLDLLGRAQPKITRRLAEIGAQSLQLMQLASHNGLVGDGNYPLLQCRAEPRQLALEPVEQRLLAPGEDQRAAEPGNRGDELEGRCRQQLVQGMLRLSDIATGDATAGEVKRADQAHEGEQQAAANQEVWHRMVNP